jgi:hypothetical protein
MREPEKGLIRKLGRLSKTVGFQFRAPSYTHWSWNAQSGQQENPRSLAIHVVSL